MNLEETLIRENATKKITKRNVISANVGPPVTLVNAGPERRESISAKKVPTPTSGSAGADTELQEMQVISPTSAGVMLNNDLMSPADPDKLNRQSSSLSAPNFKDFVPK